MTAHLIWAKFRSQVSKTCEVYVSVTLSARANPAYFGVISLAKEYLPPWT